MTARHFGFTGTREGVLAAQRRALHHLFATLEAESFVTLHHGGCVGADESAHRAWAAEQWPWHRILIHSPTDAALFAKQFTGEVWILPPKPYLVRNRDIVNASEMLVACPNGPEKQRSGTWSTIRYARRIGRPVVIVMPDGSIIRDHPAKEMP